MTPPNQEKPPFGLIRPVSLLLGFGLGLVLLVGLGRTTEQRDFHPKFTRFHPNMAPETLYYPTVAEMSAIVRRRCRPDQILVIVGGNSILYGVGQPADFDFDQLTSMGAMLASALIGQLNGRLEIGAGPGAVFDITFRPN